MLGNERNELAARVWGGRENNVDDLIDKKDKTK